MVRWIFSQESSPYPMRTALPYMGFRSLESGCVRWQCFVMIESITAKIKYNQSDGVATWVYVDEMHELWGEEYSLHALEKDVA